MTQVWVITLEGGDYADNVYQLWRQTAEWEALPIAPTILARQRTWNFGAQRSAEAYMAEARVIVVRETAGLEKSIAVHLTELARHAKTEAAQDGGPLLIAAHRSGTFKHLDGNLADGQNVWLNDLTHSRTEKLYRVIEEFLLEANQPQSAKLEVSWNALCAEIRRGSAPHRDIGHLKHELSKTINPFAELLLDWRDQLERGHDDEQICEEVADYLEIGADQRTQFERVALAKARELFYKAQGLTLERSVREAAREARAAADRKDAMAMQDFQDVQPVLREDARELRELAQGMEARLSTMRELLPPSGGQAPAHPLFVGVFGEEGQLAQLARVNEEKWPELVRSNDALSVWWQTLLNELKQIQCEAEIAENLR